VGEARCSLNRMRDAGPQASPSAVTNRYGKESSVGDRSVPWMGEPISIQADSRRIGAPRISQRRLPSKEPASSPMMKNGDRARAICQSSVSAADDASVVRAVHTMKSAKALVASANACGTSDVGRERWAWNPCIENVGARTSMASTNAPNEGRRIQSALPAGVPMDGVQPRPTARGTARSRMSIGRSIHAATAMAEIHRFQRCAMTHAASAIPA